MSFCEFHTMHSNPNHLTIPHTCLLPMYSPPPKEIKHKQTSKQNKQNKAKQRKHLILEAVSDVAGVSSPSGRCFGASWSALQTLQPMLSQQRSAVVGQISRIFGIGTAFSANSKGQQGCHIFLRHLSKLRSIPLPAFRGKPQHLGRLTVQ